MRALPVRPEPLWRTDFRQRIAVSLWFVPAIFAAASIAVANLTIWLDAQVDAAIGIRPDMVSDPGSAATFAAAIAAATLAFVAVVFATTLVAIQLAASQYSPRTVRIFVASLHGVVRLMRVQYLLEAIATESRQAIGENFPPASAYVDAEPPLPDPSPCRLCYTGPSGVITAADLGGLAELGRQNQC